MQSFDRRGLCCFALFNSLVVVALLSGCRTAPLLPTIDTSTPGWQVQQGQAVWRFEKDSPEIAGELMAASDQAGQSIVEFTKTPFPMVIAQIRTNGWRIEFGSEKRYSGRGQPPEQLLWLHVAQALAGKELPNLYYFNNTNGSWRLENIRSGESLEGYLSQ